MVGILCLLDVLWVALASGQIAPALDWEYDGFSWQLYTGPATWQQAEDWCRGVGDGWQLASLTTPQQFEYTKQQLLSASTNKTVFTTGDAVTWCDEKLGHKNNQVWIGLHDPSNFPNAQGDTWKAVASKFDWSDGRQSPYLASGAKPYFGGNASEAEYCIGFSFCSLGTRADKPSVTLTKHPCEWAMSFLCKGPPRKAPVGPPRGDANGSTIATPPATAPASNPIAKPTGCEVGTVCAAIVGPVVSAVGAIVVALVGYLGVRHTSRSKASEESAKNAPAAPAAPAAPPSNNSTSITVNPIIQVLGGGGVSTIKAPLDTRPMAAQRTTTL